MEFADVLAWLIKLLKQALDHQLSHAESHLFANQELSVHELVTRNEINYSTLVSIWSAHKTAFCAAAVRQHGCQIAEQPSSRQDGENKTQADFRQQIVR